MDNLNSNLNFERVGGLDEIIQTLKDLILLPLRCREVTEVYDLKRTKGVLFHGPPGTGKTLVAGALANECSSWDRKFSFFSRKGSDILSKYIGDSEMRLRKLFELAYKQRPAIIFFDELDGLAPPRGNRMDHAHTSVVSVLLAHMDGVGCCDDVFVIGATNRIDGIDPALRRPGRFDRELYFPLPSCQGREAILRVHTSRWPSPPPDELIKYLAKETSGYCGADLQALCSGAVMHCLKSKHPTIYSDPNIRITPSKLKVTRENFLQAKTHLVPASERTGTTPTKMLAYFIEPLCQNIVEEIIDMLRKIYPQEVMYPGLSTASHSELLTYPRLLLTGSPLQGLTSHIAPALLHHFEQLPVYTLDEVALFRGQAPETSCVDLLMMASHNLPGILYLPNVTEWWQLVEETTRTIFISLLTKLFSNKPLLLLATAHVEHINVPEQLQLLFTKELGNIASVRNPSQLEREHFFFPLFNISTKVVLPPLPVVDLTIPNDTSLIKQKRREIPKPYFTRKSKRFRRSSRRLQEQLVQIDEPWRMKRAQSEETSSKKRRKEAISFVTQAPSSDTNKGVTEVAGGKVSKSEGQILGEILSRLVIACEEFPVRSLEIIYGEVNYYFSHWRQHSQVDTLIQDLQRYVAQLEVGSKLDSVDLSAEREFKYSNSPEFMRSIKQEPNNW